MSVFGKEVSELLGVTMEKVTNTGEEIQFFAKDGRQRDHLWARLFVQEPCATFAGCCRGHLYDFSRYLPLKIGVSNRRGVGPIC